MYMIIINSYCTNYKKNIAIYYGASYRVAAWIGYYRLLSEIIGYFHIVLKFMNFRVAKMYGNNDTFYGSTKI